MFLVRIVIDNCDILTNISTSLPAVRQGNTMPKLKNNVFIVVNKSLVDASVTDADGCDIRNGLIILMMAMIGIRMLINTIVIVRAI